MRDDGRWWFDQQAANGTTNDPSVNADMISPAFWLVRGSEFKITRSDDPSHTPLLQTTGNCLGGQTFRSKITSYGDFRNGTVWASDQCLGSCPVQYGGQYKSTDGFQQAECGGDIQSANKIGFWCDWDEGDGSVMMIGGEEKAVHVQITGLGSQKLTKLLLLTWEAVTLNMTLVIMLRPATLQPSPTRWICGSVRNYKFLLFFFFLLRKTDEHWDTNIPKGHKKKYNDFIYS